MYTRTRSISCMWIVGWRLTKTITRSFVSWQYRGRRQLIHCLVWPPVWSQFISVHFNKVVICLNLFRVVWRCLQFNMCSFLKTTAFIRCHPFPMNQIFKNFVHYMTCLCYKCQLLLSMLSNWTILFIILFFFTFKYWVSNGVTKGSIAPETVQALEHKSRRCLKAPLSFIINTYTHTPAFFKQSRDTFRSFWGKIYWIFVHFNGYTNSFLLLVILLAQLTQLFI